MSNPAVPAGFKPMRFMGLFEEGIAPVYYRRHGDMEVTVALRVEPKHCNYQNILHGGAMATLVDVGMGFTSRAPAREKGKFLHLVTASMSVDYLGSAYQGDWVECRGRVLKFGKRMIFTECLVYQNPDRDNPRLIARASGVYAPVHGPAGEPSPSPQGEESDG